MSSVRRRLAAATMAATALLTLGACTRGFDAQTNQQYQAAVGANVHGEVDVLNALAVANEDGSATISAGLVNNTGDEDALSSVTVTTLDGKELQVRGLRSRFVLPKGKLTSLGTTADNANFRIADGAKVGYYVKVTFDFEGASPVTIEAPVVARTAEYDNVPGAELLPTEPAATETAAE
ncbi:hypothetical protein GCM10022234_09580 [Aeromicrobium panaciterrae]|uniref:hypothetical protein n=1 Tax=Aeromicrobium panaciterrae TaxID=363861 RepID=UPI0031D2BD5B